MRRLLITCAVVLAGCASSAELVRNRAAVDLSCEPEQVKAAEASPVTESVEACGHSALYVADRDGWRLHALDGQLTPAPSGIELEPLHRDRYGRGDLVAPR